jgi:hypothetical protein
MDLNGFHTSEVSVSFSWTFYYHVTDMQYYNDLIYFDLKNLNFDKDSLSLFTSTMANGLYNHHYLYFKSDF